MRSALFAILLIAAPLGACATTGTNGPAVTVEDYRLRAAKTMFATETSFDAAVLVVEQALLAGKLKGDDAARTLEVLEEARGYLLAARSAYALGDVIAMTVATTQAQTALKKVN